MDAILKTAWVGALRSGDYRQTTETLHDEIGYCCLGVFCDVLATTHPDRFMWADGEFLEFDEDFDEDFVSGGSNTNELSGRLLELAGFDDGVQQVLIVKNDTDRSTFDEIADWIEVNL